MGKVNHTILANELRRDPMDMGYRYLNTDQIVDLLNKKQFREANLVGDGEALGVTTQNSVTTIETGPCTGTCFWSWNGSVWVNSGNTCSNGCSCGTPPSTPGTEEGQQATTSCGSDSVTTTTTTTTSPTVTITKSGTASFFMNFDNVTNRSRGELLFGPNTAVTAEDVSFALVS